MRLHRLEVEAFLAFAEREVVDFDALAESGLFLLTGRTGAGKTTLLDAVCFALYGGVPGARTEATLRSDHAAPDRLTRVVLEATLAGQRVRVTREPDQERPKLRGEGLTKHGHAVRVVRLEADGTETLVAGRPDDARKELEDLLGLSKEEFCQVVLLPQGGFQRFLHASSDEREKLLRELFDVARFTRVEHWLKDRKDEAVDARDRALAAVHDQLQRADEHAVPPPPDGEARSVPRVDGQDLGAPVAWLDDRLEEAREAEAAAGAAAATAAGRRDAAAAALQAGEVLAHRQDEAQETRARLRRLEAGRAERDAAAAELEAGRRAASAAPLLDVLATRVRGAAEAERAAREALRALHEDDAAEAGLGAAREAPASPDVLRGVAARRRTRAGEVQADVAREAALAAAEAEVAALRRTAAGQTALAERQERAEAAACAALPEARARLAEAQDAAAALPGLTAERDAATARAAAAQRRDAALEARGHALDAKVAAQEALSTAIGEQIALQERRREGLAFEMAARLEELEQCPVCGSEDHPHPAGPPEGGRVTDEALEAADARRLACEAARDDAAEALAAVERELAAATAIAGDDPADGLAERARAARAAAEAAAALAAGLPTARAALADLEAAHEQAAREAAAARTAAAGASADVVHRSTALEGDRAAVAAARAGHASIADHVADLAGRADRLDAAAEAVAGALSCAREAAAARAAAVAAARDAGFAVLRSGHGDEEDARPADRPGEDAPPAGRLFGDDVPGGRLFGDEAAPPLDEDATLAALADARRDDLACTDLQARIERFDHRLVELRAALEREELVAALAAPRPDLDALRADAGRTKAEAEGAGRTHAHALRRVEALTTIRSALVAAVDQAVPAVAECALVSGLSDLAQGNAGDNRLRMRLTAYVLAARLEAVAEAASLRLARMSGGRYTLEHAVGTAGGRRRAGLDLKVVDAWTGRERPPASLSGGETFMASLALALGLADVVLAEAGGHRLDTLFIDEGFGSLDDEGSLDEVLDVLDGLRDGGRVVGVVSHVAELRARIPTQLRVEKHRTGSHVRQGATPTPA